MPHNKKMQSGAAKAAPLMRGVMWQVLNKFWQPEIAKSRPSNFHIKLPLSAQTV